MPCSPIIDYGEVEGSNPRMCAQKWYHKIMVSAKHKRTIAPACEVEMVLYAAGDLGCVWDTFLASYKLSSCSLNGCIISVMIGPSYTKVRVVLDRLLLIQLETPICYITSFTSMGLNCNHVKRLCYSILGSFSQSCKLHCVERPAKVALRSASPQELLSWNRRLPKYYIGSNGMQNNLR